MKKLRIKSKIWISITFISFITIIIGVILTYYLYEKFYLEKQIERLEQQGTLLKKYYYSQTDHDKLHEMIHWTEESTNINVILTEDPMQLSAGIPITGFPDSNLITFKERQQLLSGKEVIIIRDHPTFKRKILAVAVPLFKKKILSGAIFIYQPIDDIYEPFKPLRTFMIIFMVIVLFLLVWIGHKITNYLLKPLKEMENVSKKMAKGDFSEQITVHNKDEIGQLAISLNTMAKSLNEVEMKRNQFLQNVSHELRTPLSYVKGYTEAILEGVYEDPKEINHSLIIIQKETERLIRLVHDLLDLAQLEDDSYPMKKNPIVYSQLISDVINNFDLALKNKQIQVHLTLDEDIIIEGDEDRIAQVLSNLIHNAISYSQNGRDIIIKLSLEDHLSILKIKDHGPGIPKKDLPHIFERFYRVDKARTRNKGGSGLGLSICSQIIKKHSGQIHVESEKEKGTEFTIIIPCFSEIEG
ncbi:sensor histidine kinase [Heyndrickxia sp. NPDC080065]|uniref:sensor histidine kinase n=1 Tax=Heyndrickxia sp. NPDC080065 TaxID=3390568 RepID=UPI003D042745